MCRLSYGYSGASCGKIKVANRLDYFVKATEVTVFISRFLLQNKHSDVLGFQYVHAKCIFQQKTYINAMSGFDGSHSTRFNTRYCLAKRVPALEVTSVTMNAPKNEIFNNFLFSPPAYCFVLRSASAVCPRMYQMN